MCRQTLTRTNEIIPRFRRGVFRPLSDEKQALPPPRPSTTKTTQSPHQDAMLLTWSYCAKRPFTTRNTLQLTVWVSTEGERCCKQATGICMSQLYPLALVFELPLSCPPSMHRILQFCGPSSFLPIAVVPVPNPVPKTHRRSTARVVAIFYGRLLCSFSIARARCALVPSAFLASSRASRCRGWAKEIKCHAFLTALPSHGNTICQVRRVSDGRVATL